MKLIGILIGFVFGSILSAKAQSPKATVYLVRSPGPDRYVPYFTYDDTVLLCKLGDGRHSVHEVEPGEHKFHAQYKGKLKTTPDSVLQLTLEAGRTYYISVNLATKAFSRGTFYCEQLSEADGKKRIEVYALDKKCL
ncbi:MAG: hypothetical protein EAY75_08415 [Bacteroidetes bacterium]|nr:MAG: hypothetical protein EAY75_08415 [Bacteroidota bacterium]